MLLKCKSNYFYYYIDRVSYRSVFPSGAMVISNVNQFLPFTFSYIVDNTATK